MSEFPVDQIIVASNEHWLYIDFWPLIAWSYRTLFPGVTVKLAFLSERREDDPFVAQLREHGEVVLVRPVRSMPQAAQAKLARYFVAAQQGDDAVCYTDDIDWIPIDREWHASRVRRRQPGSMLLVGSEVYNSPDGQAPAGLLTAEGSVFKRLFNPHGFEFPAFLQGLAGREGKHRDPYSRADHEGMDCTTSQDVLGVPLFSDEALMAQLRKERPIPVTLAERNFKPGIDSIDRSAWEAFDVGKLKAGEYIGAHTGRPYLGHREGNDRILRYLQERYNGAALPSPLDHTPRVDPDMEFGGSGLTREAYEWICASIPAGGYILEFGSGHVSTNYLSRYFWLASVESDLNYVNQYPSHYIYAPQIGKGWYDPERVAYGLSHKRLVHPQKRKCELIIIDGPCGSEPRRGFIDHLDMFDLSTPILVDDAHRDVERDMVWALSGRTGREPQWFEYFAVV